MACSKRRSTRSKRRRQGLLAEGRFSAADVYVGSQLDRGPVPGTIPTRPAFSAISAAAARAREYWYQGHRQRADRRDAGRRARPDGIRPRFWSEQFPPSALLPRGRSRSRASARRSAAPSWGRDRPRLGIGVDDDRVGDSRRRQPVADTRSSPAQYLAVGAGADDRRIGAPFDPAETGIIAAASNISFIAPDSAGLPRDFRGRRTMSAAALIISGVTSSAATRRAASPAPAAAASASAALSPVRLCQMISNLHFIAAISSVGAWSAKPAPPGRRLLLYAMRGKQDQKEDAMKRAICLILIMLWASGAAAQDAASEATGVAQVESRSACRSMTGATRRRMCCAARSPRSWTASSRARMAGSSDR